MDQLEFLQWDSDRRYGVELEINAFDGKSRPGPDDKSPKGIAEVGDIIVRRTGHGVKITKWGHTHNNDFYVVKPDGSCGMEVCTPILKGWDGLSQVIGLADIFRTEGKIKSDERCSLHVHVNVNGCDLTEVASAAAWWVKCEPVFIDSMPARRKKSRYCQVVGMSDMFDHAQRPDPRDILDRLASAKYFTFNDYHYNQKDSGKQRDTIEYRLAENSACLDPYYIKNWVRLVVHFTDRAMKRGMPGTYKSSDPLSGLSWLDPIAVFEFLGFMPGQYQLSPGLAQVRDWFLARIYINIFDGNLPGLWSKIGRSHAFKEVVEIILKIEKADGRSFDFTEAMYPLEDQDALYLEKYQM